MIFAAALLAGLLAAPAEAAAPRAVWVWEPEAYAMLTSGRAAGKAIKLLEKKAVSSVYLYADAYEGRNLIESDPKDYRRLISRLRKHGIAACALLGSWHLRTQEYVLPEKRPEALAMLRRVLDYNSKAAPGERFSCVNLDIEPHMLKNWGENRAELLAAFLDMGAAMMALKKEYPSAPEIGPAIPFWLDGINLEWNGTEKPASEHVQDVFDYTVLMDYRDRAGGDDGMIRHAALELEYGAASGKKVLIGVEVTPNEVKKVSFSGMTEEAMEGELALAEEAFAKSPAFAGFVIHHYDSYRLWLEGQAKKGKKK